MKKLLKFYKLLLLLFPFFMFFSFRPWISLGTNETMNFEISLTMIWLVLFDVVGFFVLIFEKRLLGLRKYWKWLILPLYFAITIFWSHDRLRAALIFGVLLCIYFAGFSIFALKDKILDEKFKKDFFKSMFFSSLVISAWCFVQSFLDIGGFPDDISYICAGCTYRVFGFPHPNGFGVEPQFMGNLLLVPILTAMYFFLENKMFKRRNMIITYAALVTTLFFTLSRGAIYAFGLSTIIGVIYWVIKNKKARAFGIWGAALLAFIIALNLQGFFAQISPTDDTYFSGISKSVNQLTLGKIDLGWSEIKKYEVNRGTPGKDEGAIPVTVSPTESEPVEAAPVTVTEQSMFGGYVEGSTNERLNSWKSALEISKDHLNVAFFGVGFGSAPLALYEYEKLPTSKEIINNQYVNTFFETGIIGVILVGFSLYLAYRGIKDLSDRNLLYIIIFTYAITIVFFSGLPNALHIYLLPPMLALVLSNKKTEKK